MQSRQQMNKLLVFFSFFGTQFDRAKVTAENVQSPKIGSNNMAFLLTSAKREDWTLSFVLAVLLMSKRPREFPMIEYVCDVSHFEKPHVACSECSKSHCIRCFSDARVCSFCSTFVCCLPLRKCARCHAVCCRDCVTINLSNFNEMVREPVFLCRTNPAARGLQGPDVTDFNRARRAALFPLLNVSLPTCLSNLILDYTHLQHPARLILREATCQFSINGFAVLLQCELYHNGQFQFAGRLSDPLNTWHLNVFQPQHLLGVREVSLSYVSRPVFIQEHFHQLPAYAVCEELLFFLEYFDMQYDRFCQPCQ